MTLPSATPCHVMQVTSMPGSCSTPQWQTCPQAYPATLHRTWPASAAGHVGVSEMVSEWCNQQHQCATRYPELRCDRGRAAQLDHIPSSCSGASTAHRPAVGLKACATSCHRWPLALRAVPCTRQRASGRTGAPVLQALCLRSAQVEVGGLLAQSCARGTPALHMHLSVLHVRCTAGTCQGVHVNHAGCASTCAVLPHASLSAEAISQR